MKRFWDKVEKTNTCWLWTAYITSNGYGIFGFEGKLVRAHRYAYEVSIGPIPKGLELDHLCRVRHCVNPNHLEPVTRAENVKRGLSPNQISTFHRSKTHCPQGHSYSGENLYENKTHRSCKTCKRDFMRRKRTKKRRRVNMDNMIESMGTSVGVRSNRSIGEELAIEAAELNTRLIEVLAAVEALKSNPEIEKIINLVSKVHRRY